MSRLEKSHTSRVLKELEEHSAEENHGHDPNGERWLVSYADMMTLLFGFFVLPYVFSEDPQKLKAAMAQVAEQVETPKQEAQPKNINSETLTELAFRQPCRACFNGVFYQNSRILDVLKAPKSSAFIVTTVDPHGPAASAGLKVGDVIDKVDGKDFETVGTSIFPSFPTSALVTFSIYRQGRAMELEFELDALSAETRSALSNLPRPRSYVDGNLTLEEVHPGNRMVNYIPGYVKGVLVTSGTNRDWEVEIGKGDVIMSIDGKDIGSPSDYSSGDLAAARMIRFWRAETKTVELNTK